MSIDPKVRAGKGGTAEGDRMSMNYTYPVIILIGIAVLIGIPNIYNKDYFLKLFTDPFPVITSFIALCATISAWLAARCTQNHAETLLMIDLHREYGSPEMSKAMNDIRDWKTSLSLGSVFHEIYRDNFNNNNIVPEEVHSGRRRLKFYFLRIAKLLDANKIDKKALSIVPSRDGFNFFLEYVIPLEVVDYKRNRETDADYHTHGDYRAFLRLAKEFNLDDQFKKKVAGIDEYKGKVMDVSSFE